MKILVCGGRDFSRYDLLSSVLNEYHITHILHGGASGADTLAGIYARNRNIVEEVYPALWGMYGKKAGYIRNNEMAEQKPDLVIAFPGGKGTDMMIGIARNKHIQVRKVEEDTL